MKALIKFILKKIYGVRGALRPPRTRRFPQYQYWKLAKRLYNWSGIPEDWKKSLGDWDGPIITRELYEKYTKATKAPRG